MFPPDIVAGQMSLLDINLISRICPSEFMGQAWTNPKTQHLSMNINLCMDRLNMVSYWVPTMILGAGTLAARVEYVLLQYAYCYLLFTLHLFPPD